MTKSRCEHDLLKSEETLFSCFLRFNSVSGAVGGRLYLVLLTVAESLAMAVNDIALFLEVTEVASGRECIGEAIGDCSLGSSAGISRGILARIPGLDITGVEVFGVGTVLVVGGVWSASVSSWKWFSGLEVTGVEVFGLGAVLVVGGVWLVSIASWR